MILTTVNDIVGEDADANNNGNNNQHDKTPNRSKAHS